MATWKVGLFLKKRAKGPVGSFSGATVANTEIPSDSASAFSNCACFTFNSCVTSYFESAVRPLPATFSISSFVCFKPAGGIEEIASGFCAEKSFMALSTRELICDKSVFRKEESPPCARVAMPTSESSMPSNNDDSFSGTETGEGEGVIGTPPGGRRRKAGTAALRLLVAETHTADLDVR